MRLLAIETSCDETGISIIDAEGSQSSGASFTLLADTLASQVELHSEYGGVYPTLAKREHIKALPLLLKQALREEQLKMQDIDAIAVTHGPGLEPALWTGITFAQELSETHNIPIVPVNHMEGHIYSTLIESDDSKNFRLKTIDYPAVALLISGGHTDMVLVREPFNYEYLGGTLDDAVGEAFDKVARMLGLSYPGGPIISKLAQEARVHSTPEGIAISDPLSLAAHCPGSATAIPSGANESTQVNKPLPRPMLHSKDFNFSFSGLKTAVLYRVKELHKQYGESLPKDVVAQTAMEFEDACADVLASKVSKAIQETGANTLIIGGGVAANNYIHNTIQEKLSDKNNNKITILKPYKGLTGDNALMIAVAGYLRAERGEYITDLAELKAHGTLRLK